MQTNTVMFCNAQQGGHSLFHIPTLKGNEKVSVFNQFKSEQCLFASYDNTITPCYNTIMKGFEIVFL